MLSAKWPVWRTLGALLLVAWFAYFLRPSLFNGFNDDDPMNMYEYFRVSWPVLLRKIAIFFEPSYRPVGGALFKLSYDLFGYEPVPLHVMIAAVLLGNIFLARRLAELVTGSAAVGFLCAFLTVYHTRMANLYYAPAFLYDVLCFAFYYSALNLYIAARVQGRPPGWGRVAAVLALYALALGSKEMAVSFPVVLLGYEALFHPPAGVRWRECRAWLLGPALPALIAGGMAALFIAGKAFGPDAIIQATGYRMSLTMSHVMEEQGKYLRDIFYARWDSTMFTPALAVGLWAAVFGFAALTRRKYLAWAGVAVIVTPLPLAVLSGRGGPTLYITLVFWALIAATVFVDLCREIPRLLLPRPARPAAGVLLAAAGCAAFGSVVVKENRFVPKAMAEPTVDGKHLASEVRRVLPRIPPKAHIIFLNDTRRSFDTLFIAELIWRERSSTVWLQQHSRLSQRDIDGMDYVLEFTPDGTLRVVRRPAPGAPKSVP